LSYFVVFEIYFILFKFTLADFCYLTVSYCSSKCCLLSVLMDHSSIHSFIHTFFHSFIYWNNC